MTPAVYDTSLMDDNEQKPAPPGEPESAQPNDETAASSTRKPGHKALLAKQYMAVEALADPDDPEVKEYLAGLERALNAPD
jgi:hypothetical protein